MPAENFCFHKIYDGDSEEIKAKNALEKKDLCKLIEMHMTYDRYYLEEGQIEPSYLDQKERGIMTDGMM